MNDGEVIDSGKPADLLKKNVAFSKMINK